MTSVAQPPRELWRIAYRQRRTQQGSTAVMDEEDIDYFEDEAATLARLRNLVPNNGRVLSIHKLARVDGGLSDMARWVELVYTPPAAQGTLTPTNPPARAVPDAR